MAQEHGYAEPLAQRAGPVAVDVVVDAVSRRLHNPHGYVSETAGEYTYRLEKGSDGFWWPQDWQLLFGLSAKAPKRVSTVPVGLTCAWQGWAR